MDGWIDFEREIYPVMKLFGKVFSQTRYSVMTHEKSEAEICIPLRKSFDEFILAFEIYLHEFVYKETNVTNY